MECVRLRVKDVDFSYRCIVVRDGKGAKDRVVTLPTPVEPHLRRQLIATKRRHEADLAAGFGAVWLPDALERK
jgi:integrase